jgi:hypothetical protein
MCPSSPLSIMYSFTAKAETGVRKKPKTKTEAVIANASLLEKNCIVKIIPHLRLLKERRKCIDN